MVHGKAAQAITAVFEEETVISNIFQRMIFLRTRDFSNQVHLISVRGGRPNDILLLRIFAYLGTR